MNYIITQTPCTANKRYKTNYTKIGYMQHSTGAPGGSAKAILSTWNKASCAAEATFIIDDTGIYQCFPENASLWHCGGAANKPYISCEICEPSEARLLDPNWLNLQINGKYNTTWAVKRLQQELLALGYEIGSADGIFGAKTSEAVKLFQKANGLSADGIVGKDTLHAFQKRKDSLLKYNPDNVKDYFQDVYSKAVWLCGEICGEKGFSVNSANVLSHSEGHKKGIASNHADCDHFFAPHGKSMNDFRADVMTYISTKVLPFEKKTTVTTDKANTKEEKITHTGNIEIVTQGNKITKVTVKIS